MSKRNLRSFYYDTYTGKVEQATKFEAYPAARKHRFLLLRKSQHRPNETTIRNLLASLGVTLRKRKSFIERTKIEDLPF